MQTLMCHYFGGENMASKHRATYSVSFPPILKQECEGYNMYSISSVGTHF